MRKIIRRYLPDPERVRTHPRLRRFGRRLQPAGLWHLNRHSVPGAVGAGLFWAFIPSLTQMLPVAITAIALRVNLPLSLALGLGCQSTHHAPDVLLELSCRYVAAAPAGAFLQYRVELGMVDARDEPGLATAVARIGSGGDVRRRAWIFQHTHALATANGARRSTIWRASRVLEYAVLKFEDAIHTRCQRGVMGYHH